MEDFGRENPELGLRVGREQDGAFLRQALGSVNR